MFLVCFSIGLLLGIVIIGCAENDQVHTALFFVIVAVGMFAFFLNKSLEYRDTPKAMDVYMNRTTLEITYRDSIPVDSVVVFKNK